MANQARKQLGNNIRQRRTQLGLSQEQLAEKANLHRTYIGAVERGERNISLDNILAIAQALGISGSELLEGID
jgi:transcriptional regulator with XRE-family HTH domain